MSKIIYPDLSYKIMGILFAVHNQLGAGYKEKHYQKAIKDRFDQENVNYKEQVKIEIKKEKYIGSYFIDFIIEDKIILEIKITPKLLRDSVLQVIRYLKETSIELGILATFSRNELIYKRILRGY